MSKTCGKKTQKRNNPGGVDPKGLAVVNPSAPHTPPAFYVLITALFLSAVFPPFALGNDKAQPQGVDVDSQRLADAIYLAEGGKKTRYPYGIKSIPCEGENACRQICLNTINNNKKRFLKQSKYKDYIEFLGSRYCPLNIKGEYHLNKNWVRNVKHFYQKGGAK
jgi:hypothetical protein